VALFGRPDRQDGMKQLLVLAIALAHLGACAGAVQPSLDGRDFVLVRWTVDGADEGLVPGTTLRISFADGALSAHAGCNTMGGSYSLREGRLIVTDLFTTEMGCPADLHRQDERIAELLTGHPAITLDGDTLVLDGGAIVASLRLRQAVEPDLPLIGTDWQLTSIIEGDAVSSLPAGITSTLRLAADGSLAVEPGCNSGGGTFSFSDDTLQVGPLALTRMACPGDGDRVEAAVMAVLQGEVGYSIESGTLTITAGDRGLMYTGR
jgi:heat shock protein HslJ